MSKDSSSRGRRGYVPEPPPRPTTCQHPGCEAGGIYRAPKARHQLNDYYWFCLDHVREYNKAWDYYAGMDTGAIEQEVRLDTVWQRPTWPLGSWGSEAWGRRFAGIPENEFMPDDVREALNARMGAAGNKNGSRSETRRIQTKEEQALAVLSLTPPVTWQEVKRQYKSLVKKLHPDANGGDKTAEEQLKLVNSAYGTLKAAAFAGT